MRVVMLEAPQALRDERRAKGLDKSDEIWEGELHMVPPPSAEYQVCAVERKRLTASSRLTWDGGSADI